MRSIFKTSSCIISAFILALAASCNHVDHYAERLLKLIGRGESGPSVHIVVGEAAVSRGGEGHAAVAGFGLRPFDSLTVPRGAKIKINAGEGTFFANELSAFRLVPPAVEESCAVHAERGEYYFSARDGGALTVWFGDMKITMRSADASLKIAPSLRLAEFFVLNGSARVERGSAGKTVSSCNAVVLDAAGISEDEAVTANRATAIERLKGWVGAATIVGAANAGQCEPDGAGDVSAQPPAKTQMSSDTSNTSDTLNTLDTLDKHDISERGV